MLLEILADPCSRPAQEELGSVQIAIPTVGQLFDFHGANDEHI